MRLKRFVAKDMREALTLVKDELGADAIIMSNKRVAAGVEIVAGVESLPMPRTAQPQSGGGGGGALSAMAGAMAAAQAQAQAQAQAAQAQAGGVNVTIGGNQTRPSVDRRLIGGKNQAYAQSLIEILERQQAMSKEQGDALMQDIAKKNSEANLHEGLRAAPDMPEVKERPDLIADRERRRGSDLKGTGVSRIINPSPLKDFDVDPNLSRPVGEEPPMSDGDDDDMADPTKKAGPSTIDPSLDEDADLFKTPPLPLNQQRDFKNFFVKSKTKQEKEEYESKAGINTYRAPSATDATVRQDLEKMRSEVENIRKLLQFELAGLLQDNRSRNEPVKAMIYKLLHSVGFSDKVSDLIVNKLTTESSFNTAWRETISVLERSILVGDDEIVSRGGIVTLIGPAGVGKTTTLAKLAARFVMRYGPQRVAIVTADHYRIGAVEQIKTYGRIMGCSTYAVKNLSELPQLLYTLSDKSLILVDTAGVGFKDERFNNQLSQLKLQSSLKLKHYLVLPCTTQRRVLQHAYDHFSVVGLTGLILTKIDECQNLGDALSLCIEMKLPISYVTDGQRVPEDLDLPRPNALARKALSAVEDDVAQSLIAKG